MLYSSSAQVKWINPLPCDSWNKGNFLSFEVMKRSTPEPQQNGKYMQVYSPSQSSYHNYTNNKKVYSWNPYSNDYINNIQVIRWTIQDDKSLYKFVVSNIYDEIIYEVASDKSCGLIIFPDSIIDYGTLHIEIKPKDPEYFPLIGNFARRLLISKMDDPQRLSILKEIQSCTTLECKIEILKSYDKTLDILSLLELEKMRDPLNPIIDKLYWELVSRMCYDNSSKSEER